MDELSRVDDERRQLMAEIVDTLEICGGQVPENPAEFWRAAAVRHNLHPPEGMLATARSLFELLGETWDDDYIDDADGHPSIAAYEALHSAITGRGGYQMGSATPPPADTPDDEDDDDSIGRLDQSFNTEAPPTTPDLETVMGRIEKGSLILNPEWQRSFVWKPQKQRRLIESILLGLPIPSFLLFQDTATGRSYVIDGRQRLETIARFRSPKERRGEPKRRFKTFPPKTPGWGEGQRLHPAASKYYDQLPPEFKTTFDNTPLIVCTFKDIPPDRLYQIFKRYNTGAVALKAAEIRNAVYQGSPLHEMMYRIAGEHRDESKYFDSDEREIGESLRATMGSKRERYGAYDFVGRYFAFSYMTTGSVANATNAFMVTHGNDTPKVEAFRHEFIAVFRTTLALYSDYPLVDPRPDGLFHAFLATLQMVSAKRMLEHVQAGSVDAERVKQSVADQWAQFAQEALQTKQNSGVFWGFQKRWIAQLESSLGLKPTE